MLVDSFGRWIGDRDYNPIVDFNGDGVIDVVDFTLLKLNFGELGAPPITESPSPTQGEGLGGVPAGVHVRDTQNSRSGMAQVCYLLAAI
jgi:hypothetical protein